MRVTVPSRPSGPLVVARSAATVALAASAALALGATPAGAEVVLSPIVTGLDAPRTSPGPTIVAPDGTRRTLAPVPLGDQDGYAVPVLSPDHRWIARPSGARALVIPTDGGPRGSLLAPGVRTDFRTTVWWDADATHVLSEGGDDRSGRPVVQRCAVATKACSTAPTGGRELLGTLRSGASLWAGPDVDVVVAGIPDTLLEDWTAATPRTVAQLRRAVRQRIPSRLIHVGPDGRAAQVLRRRNGSFARGLDTYTVAGEPSPDGVLAQHVRRRHRVATRRRAGGLQMRIVGRETLRRWLRISDDGRVHPFAFRTTGGDRRPGRNVVVPGPAGAWIVSLASRRGATLVGVADPAGRVRRLTVGGAPLTAASLHAALGLDAVVSGPPTEPTANLRPAGYEAATDSAIVTYDDQENRTVVARVPLAGAAPTLVEHTAESAAVHVIAW